MVTAVVVCGDSFACGSGLPIKTSFEHSFGGLVANHFDVPLHVYARSGCCNYIIYLQVLKVIKDYRHKEKPVVIISTTNHSRFTFPSDFVSKDHQNYTLEDVDYNSYFPYGKIYGDYRQNIPFKPTNPPKLVSETVSNVLHYLSGSAKGIDHLFVDVQKKLEVIKTYYEELYDDEIKETYDTGLFLMMHGALKEAGIRHLIMTPSKHKDRFIDEDSFFYNDWGKYLRLYPDKGKSGHCDETGHRIVSVGLIKRLS